MSLLKNHGHCDRCNIQTNVTKMSKFNEDMCCPVCIETEKGHSDYGRAVRVENLAVRNGNYNFEGVGLPIDLVVSEEQKSINSTQVCIRQVDIG